MKRIMTPEEKVLDKELRSQAATPSKFFEYYDRMYNFTIDACALPWNTKLTRFWSPTKDGLKQSWAEERLWINPPYGKGMIAPWVEKAINAKHHGAALLLPARTDTDWFAKLWTAHEIGFVDFRWHRGRLHFLPPPGITYSSPNERHFVALVRL